MMIPISTEERVAAALERTASAFERIAEMMELLVSAAAQPRSRRRMRRRPPHKNCTCEECMEAGTPDS
jgi:hypothetical protein